jgi:hypothetical protein
MVSTKYPGGGNEQKEEEQKCVIREHWRNLNLIYSSNEGGKLPMWKRCGMGRLLEDKRSTSEASISTRAQKRRS